MRITDSELRHAYVDLGKKGRSAGDVDVYTMLLFNKRIQATVARSRDDGLHGHGHDGPELLRDVRSSEGRDRRQGVIGSRLIYALAVVGGTGLYDNVQRLPDRDLAEPQAARGSCSSSGWSCDRPRTRGS